MSSGSYKNTVYFVCAIAALGGLLFGLDQGFIANSLGAISSVYHLDVQGGESYAAILATGGIAGAILSGIFARLLGRKKSLVIAGFLFSILSIMSATLPSFDILVACRFGIGFAVGIASFIVPLYLSETAPASIRGSMGSLFQFMITIGIFLVSIINVLIIKFLVNPHSSVPAMFVVIAIFSIIMFIGSFVLPESPRWLVLRNRKDEAFKVLQKLLNTNKEVNDEIHDIEEALNKDKTKNIGIIFKGYFIKLLLLGILLQMFQQLVGINLMIYYAPTILGYVSMTGILAVIAVPTVNMLFTIPAIRWVERWGRKKLLYFGAVIMLISLVVAGLAFKILSTPELASGLGSDAKIMLMSAIIVYIFGFATSWGPVVWIMCSEIFPIEGREIGITITTVVNWTFAGIVMEHALSFMKAYGNSSIFYLFAVFCVLGMLFLKFFVPETKGISLEQLEINLKNGNRLKDLGK